MYVQSDTLLLADVFENFRNKYIKIYELYPSRFLSAPRLSWQVCLKKVEVEFELLTNIDMLLMVEKGIRYGICHAIHRYAKANDKYMKNYDKNMKSSYLVYLDANNLYWSTMSQKLPVNDFEWEENIHKFNEDFIQNYDENSNEGYILEVDDECPKNCLIFIVIYHFYLKERKLKSVTSLFVPYCLQCCAYKSFKTGIKSWINTKKSTQRNSI